MTERTIFQKIWDEDIPSHTLYRNEDSGLLVMLDVYPATEGHTLVVPREPVDLWTDMPQKRQLQVALLGSFVGKRLQKILKPLRVTKHTIGFNVPHVHDQYIPSYIRGDTARLFNPARMEAPVDSEQLKETCSALAFPRDLSCNVDDALAKLSERLDIRS